MHVHRIPYSRGRMHSQLQYPKPETVIDLHAGVFRKMIHGKLLRQTVSDVPKPLTLTLYPYKADKSNKSNL